MTSRLRLGAALSFALHVAAIGVLLIGLPAAKPPDQPEEQTVAMLFADETPKAEPAQTPAPASAPEPTPPSPEPPKPTPPEPTPPPPPPPSPPPPPVAA